MKDAAALFIRSPEPAYLEILRLLRDNEPHTITIVAIGPMTNLALAAAEDPLTFLKVKEVVVMGGNIDQANDPKFQTLLGQTSNIQEPPFRLIKQPPGPIRDLLNMRNQVAPVTDYNTFADPVAAARVYALTSRRPHATMPAQLPSVLMNRQEMASPPLLSPYPDALPEQLNVTLFPMDITGKHVLTRGHLEASLAPLLSARSPLADWVSSFMKATFDKTELQSEGVSRDAVGLQLHDPLPIWYCMDQDDPKWVIGNNEDIRVETSGQWTKGAFVTDRRTRDCKDEHTSDADGNRLRRCIDSPGRDKFGSLLLEQVFGG